MAEAWGAILRFLGAVLSGIYDVIPSYGVAIILLTILVRVVLIPLTVKQIRSMSAMQKIQPELKRIQQKYKGDRQKMNEELMKLYKEHGVNPLGGCFPLLMQAPVFIALYSVLRAAVPVPALPVAAATPQEFPVKTTICRPIESIGTTTTLNCEITSSDGKSVEEKQVEVTDAKTNGPLPTVVTLCKPGDVVVNGQSRFGFKCQSPTGTGHLPRENGSFKATSLGDALVQDKATFLGMHLACSPTQATSKATIRQCTAADDAAGGASLAAYYSLIALMVGTTYFQQKQMSKQATGPQAKQMQMMGRIMPIFLGFISLSMPSGVIIYWVVSNLWTIGQQQFFLSRQHAAAAAAPPPAASGGDKGKPSKPQKPKPKPKR
ncbi:MAG: YidC/Oxa1 family membrane protein insertase [Actinomycetota bacterium]